MKITHILKNGVVLEYDPDDAISAKAAAEQARRADEVAQRRQYREDGEMVTPGPRDEFVASTRDWWRGKDARTDRRTDAGELLARSSGEPRARLLAQIGERGRMWEGE
jgi:hypothetical protein